MKWTDKQLNNKIYRKKCHSVTYEIYLEHQPQEPLYVTDSKSDAQDYYDEYKQYHSDMYITKK